jgi:non-canonical (house-cleaning) NTP pyrophosphatase
MCAVPYCSVCCLAAAKAKGFDKVTVGDILAEKHGAVCNKNDPHLFLTAGHLSRIPMMEQAVICALGQSLFNA